MIIETKADWKTHLVRKFLEQWRSVVVRLAASNRKPAWVNAGKSIRRRLEIRISRLDGAKTSSALIGTKQFFSRLQEKMPKPSKICR